MSAFHLGFFLKKYNHKTYSRETWKKWSVSQNFQLQIPTRMLLRIWRSQTVESVSNKNDCHPFFSSGRKKNFFFGQNISKTKVVMSCRRNCNRRRPENALKKGLQKCKKKSPEFSPVRPINLLYVCRRHRSPPGIQLVFRSRDLTLVHVFRH